jgi:hypothetical protein
MARHPVTNQMSIGSEKVPISGERARNGKFESTPHQRGIRCELDTTPGMHIEPLPPLPRRLSKLQARGDPVREDQPPKGQGDWRE